MLVAKGLNKKAVWLSKETLKVPKKANTGYPKKCNGVWP